MVLGLNCADKHEIAAALIRKDSVTYRNIVDSSEKARNVVYRGYRMSGVPLNYVIDREGKVVAAWYGYSKKRPPGQGDPGEAELFPQTVSARAVFAPPLLAFGAGVQK